MPAPVHLVRGKAGQVMLGEAAPCPALPQTVGVMPTIFLQKMGNTGCLTWSLSFSLWLEKSSHAPLDEEPLGFFYFIGEMTWVRTNFPLALFDLDQVSKLFSTLITWTILLLHKNAQWQHEKKSPRGNMRQLLLMAAPVCQAGHDAIPWRSVKLRTVCVCDTLVWDERDFQKFCTKFYVLTGENFRLGSQKLLRENWRIAWCTLFLLNPHFVSSTLYFPFFSLLWFKHYFTVFFLSIFSKKILFFSLVFLIKSEACRLLQVHSSFSNFLGNDVALVNNC